MRGRPPPGFFTHAQAIPGSPAGEFDAREINFWKRGPTSHDSDSHMVGWVFLSEGIQKFLFPAALGVGRFAKIGIPPPQFFGPFVGVVEIVCGAPLIVGLLTRLASIPLLIDILVAIATTKLPMLAKAGFLGDNARGRDGLLHASRSNFPADRRGWIVLAGRTVDTSGISRLRAGIVPPGLGRIFDPTPRLCAG